MNWTSFILGWIVGGTVVPFLFALFLTIGKRL